MKKIVFPIVLALLMISLMAGCAQPTKIATQAPTQETVATEAPIATEIPTDAPAAGPIVVIDALDRTVEFETLPSRIVIVGKAGFMVSDASFLFPEAVERIIGYVPGTQTPNDFISAVFHLPESMEKVSTDSGAEQIAPLKPDLVLMKSFLKNSLGDSVEQLGVKVIYFDLESTAAINKDILNLGILFGNTEKAEQIVNLYEDAIKSVEEKTSGLTADQKPTALVMQYSDKGGEIAFKVPPMDWLQTSLVEMAGGTPLWKDVPTDGWTTVTFEQIAAWNPQMMFLVDYKGKAVEVVEQLKADDKWMLLDAVQNNKLYAFPLDFQSWDQPDTRWALALSWLSTKLQPELFPETDMNLEIMSFYQDFYGLEESVITETILPLVKGDL